MAVTPPAPSELSGEVVAQRRVTPDRTVGMGRFGAVPTVRYFAQAREAAGTGAEEVPGATVGGLGFREAGR